MTVPREPTREISRQTFLRAAAGALAAGTVFGSVRATADPKTSGWPQPNGPTGSFTLVFEDEFPGTTLNTNNWSASGSEWGGQGDSSMNGVSTIAANVAVNNGLTLTLSSSTVGSMIVSDPGYASHGFTFTEGIVEAKIMFAGNGSEIYNWPAFWTTCYPVSDWPSGGENDIAEGVYGTIELHVVDATHGGQGGQNAGYVGGAWHVFTLQRTATQSIFWYDGVNIATINTTQNAFPHFIILNNGYGTQQPGPLGTGATGAMRVEYVRAWTVA